MLQRGWAFALVLFAATSAHGADLVYKNELLRRVVERVPSILKTYDTKTGRFGSGIWICRDQHAMYPLAVVYSQSADGNPYYHDRKILDVIIKAGQALIDDADEKGRWVFRKKDGSTWGMIWMPWTYSRWVRTFALVRDDMPDAARKAWSDALTLGYTGIAKTQLHRVHNIPAHHAMGLYVAGKTLDRPEWCKQAADFLMKVVGKQAEGGYWSENRGPVVAYNFVYTDALGTYYALSGDERVRSALEKAARFHHRFTYPDGSAVETIDERNPYKKRVSTGNVGFTFTPTGRAWLQNQWTHYGLPRLSSDLIASLVLYGQEGAIAGSSAQRSDDAFVLTEGGKDRAITLRRGPWFVCLSGYTAPIPKSRWIQDRQNLVSIYHDKVGVILGGGNTKLQPAWSTFTVGDPRLLRHKPGDTKPDFMPKGKLYHVPKSATVAREPDAGLDLTYGPETCRIRVRPKDDRTLECTVEATSTSDMPVAAHLTLIPRLKQLIETAGGHKSTLGESPLDLSAEEVGGAVQHAGYRLSVPKVATLRWPALPHNPYRKDGHSTAAEGRIEIRIPLNAARPASTITVEIVE